MTTISLILSEDVAEDEEHAKPSECSICVLVLPVILLNVTKVGVGAKTIVLM